MTPIRLGQRVEALMVSWLRWLRGDVRDVVQMVSRQRPRTGVGSGAVDIGSGLDRWAAQLTRRRAAAVTRRWLLIAIGLALVPAIVVLAVGGSRPLWVLAVLALALVSGGVALTRGVSKVQAAQLLDRALGLHEQLGTALELQAGPGPAAGLGAMVIDDATAAVRVSLSTARASGRRAGREWAWVGVAACALVLVLALPRHSPSGPGRTSQIAASGSGSALGTRTSGATATHPRTASVPTRPSLAGSPTPAVPRDVGATRWAGTGIQPNHKAQIPVKATAHSAAHAKSTGLTVASQGAVASQPKVGGVGGNGRSSAGAAGTVSTAAQPTATGAAARAPEPAGSAARRSVSAAQSTKGTPGGATAGTRAASLTHRTGLVPTLGAGTARLPLQAGYTPAGAGHVSTQHGQSQSASGSGNSSGASGHPGSPSGSTNDQGGTSFPVIPPTGNAASSYQDLLQGFFGKTDQLSFKGW